MRGYTALSSSSELKSKEGNGLLEMIHLDSMKSFSMEPLALKKERMPSEGDSVMGSDLMVLNDVFKTIGTPVSRKNALMRA